MQIDMRALIDKLDRQARSALEAAVGLCVSRNHGEVEIEHLLVKLMDQTGDDLQQILKHYGVDRARLARELAQSLDSLKGGSRNKPVLGGTLLKTLREAWTLGSINYGASSVRTGHIILALVVDPELSRLVRMVSAELGRIPGESFLADFPTIVESSEEEVESGYAPAPGAAAGPGPAGTGGFLDRYCTDLTQRARDGKIDPVLGRDSEVRQVVDVLTRRRQNNPILVGEAGVGKTAVVEGFALRIVQGDVPPPLRGVTLKGLDLALLQAGAGVKGEFEARLKGLIDEVASSPTPIILFIDEAHTMIGAGGAAGQNDAANLLKPALARGELRTIAATTWSEYKKYFEKDPALARRFQLIKVEEPTEDICTIMMRGIVPALERHHHVRILDEGMEAAVRLSHRYLPDRQLPDKAVSVLDTACARLALGQNATPAMVERHRRRLEDLAVLGRVLAREAAAGADHAERIAAGEREQKEATEALADVTARWEQERDMVGQVRVLREQLERSADAAGAPDADGAQPQPIDADALRRRLEELTNRLQELQGESPLVPAFVDSAIIGQVISEWTGIPVGKMMRDDLETALSLESHLQRRVIGQDHALEAISQRIRTARAGIEDPQKPIGVFLLVGPSGVGKTETALALSDLLYGGEHNLVSINMSEFQEAHTISTLKGSPPGYVGYGEGGVLTEAVRRRPYSVVLLDEVEKAHPDVLELFFQVFDKGVMEDGEGRQIDFRNTVIVLTSNAGTETLMSLCADPETIPGPEVLVKALKPELDQVFKPAFLGRTVIIPFFPLRDEAFSKIIHLKLDKVQRRLRGTHGISLDLGDEVISAIAARCTEVESGARNIDNILTNTMLPSISKIVLKGFVEGSPLDRIRVLVGNDGSFGYQAFNGDGPAIQA